MRIEPTKPQQRVLAAIEQLLSERKTPTLDRMADHLDMTKGGVCNHLILLRAKGLVTWEPRRAGTIRPTKPGVMIIGSVS